MNAKPLKFEQVHGVFFSRSFVSANALQALRDLVELAKAENFNRVEILDTLSEVIDEQGGAPPERKIVQIAEGFLPGGDGIHGPQTWTMALCNDGTLWSFNNGWRIMPPIPQGEST